MRMLHLSLHEGENNMEQKKRVLIVSDDPHRLNSLVQKVRQEGMVPVNYLNIMAARFAAQKDEFALLLIDLTLPLEPKLGLVRRYITREDASPVVVIGKGEYLEQSGALDSLKGIKLVSDLPEVMGKGLEAFLD